MQKLMDMVTAKLVTEEVVKACDKEWFAYGLEKRVLTIFTAIPFLIIAIALSDIWTAVMYLCSFYFLRVRTNGYHAKTIVSCIAWSLILELCFVLWFLPKLNTIGSICVVNVVKDDTYVTLYNHTDVVVRAKASTSAQKVHTLYVGDTVYIYKWIYGTADDYDWASIRHYDSELQRNIFGYSANYFLS